MNRQFPNAEQLDKIGEDVLGAPTWGDNPWPGGDLSGKADLVNGTVPANQLPSFVDDVLEYANFAGLPVVGEAGKIYVTLDTNLTYRWSGSVYVEISQGLAIGETSATAYRGDRGKTAYDHSQTTGDPHGSVTNAAIGSLVNAAIEKTAPVDADMAALMDSASGNVLKKLSWANIKATLKTYFDALYTPKAALKVGLLPGSFCLIGAVTEPVLSGIDGTNLDYSTLEFADGATELNAFFLLPSQRTSQYGDAANIKIDVDFILVGTLTQNATIIFGVGLIEINAADAIDTAPPSSGTGYASATYTIGAAESAGLRRTVTITITADASISSGQIWIGRLIRKTGTDTSVANAKVLGITVYES